MKDEGTVICGGRAIIFSSRRSPEESLERQRMNDEGNPEWRTLRHDNGQLMYDPDGTLLDSNGHRSIFDDVDE